MTQTAEDKWPIAYIAISGLEKLGTKEAVNGLLDLANNQNSETKALATSALKEILLSGQDPAIREQIRSGLAAISKA